MNWEALIGVPTTLMMEGGAESEAMAIPSIVDQIRKSGFQTIEIVPAQFHPLTGRDAALFLETTFGERERKKLRETLKPFQVVTVHGSNIAIEVAECSAGREEDLWRPYIELMRFARDIGARIVTFHEIRRQEKADLSDGEMAEYHIKFGKLAAGYAQEWNLIAGFELANDIKFFRENEVINRIGSERFGLLLDIGHIALQFSESPAITDCVLEIILHFMGRIIEFHAGGVHQTGGGLKEHRPLDKNNILNHAKIMGLLQREKFQGPVIFEIFNKPAVPEQIIASFEDNLQACLEAKKAILYTSTGE